MKKFFVTLPFLIYWSLLYHTEVLKALHVILPAIFLTCYYWNIHTRRLGFFILPVILTLLIYEGMGYFAHIISAGAHVSEPYLLEKSLFSFSVPSPFNNWAEFFQQNTFVPLDLICGTAYIIYVFVFFAFAIYLYVSRFKEWAQPATLSFLIVNMMGYLTYYIYPAAPPWYVARLGLVPADLSTPPYAAGALRFDQAIGSPMMETMYASGSIVFGSMPSLHVAYPFLIVPFAFVIKRFRVSATLFFLLVAFSAVYLNHHYLIDIILGTTYAALAALVAIKLSPQLELKLSSKD